MGHTYSHILYHIIFHTKNDQAFLQKEIRPRINQYITGIIKERKAQVIRINGIEDHVHILLECKPDVAPAYLVRESKHFHRMDPSRVS